MGKKNPEFYADFRYEGVIQKKIQEKDHPEKMFSKKSQRPRG